MSRDSRLLHSQLHALTEHLNAQDEQLTDHATRIAAELQPAAGEPTGAPEQPATFTLELPPPVPGLEIASAGAGADPSETPSPLVDGAGA